MNIPLISGGDSLLCIKPARHIQRDYAFPQGAPLAHELRTHRNNNKISLLRSTVETFIHVESRYSDVLLPCIMRKYKLINFACTHDIHYKALNGPIEYYYQLKYILGKWFSFNRGCST